MFFKNSTAGLALLACGGLAIAFVGGCSSSGSAMSKEESQNFKAGPLPAEWKGWKPGMPMPKSAQKSQMQTK